MKWSPEVKYLDLRIMYGEVGSSNLYVDIVA